MAAVAVAMAAVVVVATVVVAATAAVVATAAVEAAGECMLALVIVHGEAAACASDGKDTHYIGSLHHHMRGH